MVTLKKSNLKEVKANSKTNTINTNKNKSLIIRIIIFVLFFALFITSIIFVNRKDPNDVASSVSQFVFAPARVNKVNFDKAEPDYVRSEGRRLGKQELEIEILLGKYKGQVLPLTNYLSALANVDVKEDDRIIVQIFTNEDETYYAAMYNYDRGIVLGFFVLLLILLLIIIGGKKGIKALLGLSFTLISLWFLLIPMIMRGFNSIIATIVIVIITSTASLIFLDGLTLKATSAILGCIAGATAAGLSASIVGYITPFNGFNMSEAESLILHATDKGMTISGLLVCGILISTLGAVMDVAMSIASSVHELHTINPKLNSRQLFISGMNIGRDAMGTMANTLILAFVGSSLNMLILTQSYDIPFLQLINSDFIALEVIQSVAGSMGIVLTVPFVAIISAKLMAKT